MRIAAIAILTAIVIPTCRAQESEEDRYNRALRLFQSNGRGEAETACKIMRQLVQQVPDNQRYQAAANSYCAQVKAMHNEEQTVFQQGETLAEHGNCPGAKADYQQISSLPIENSTYRDQLLRLVQDCQTRAAAQQAAAQQQGRSHQQRPDTGASEEMLRNGIRAYFKGDLKTSEDDLTKYLSTPGDKSALAYFFRGATRCSLFYLSGETDLRIQKSAIDDFKIVRQRYSTFKPPTQFFSPKILAIYQDQ